MPQFDRTDGHARQGSQVKGKKITENHQKRDKKPPKTSANNENRLKGPNCQKIKPSKHPKWRSTFMMRRALRATSSTHPMTLRLFGCHKGTVARRPQSLLRIFLHALLVVLPVNCDMSAKNASVSGPRN